MVKIRLKRLGYKKNPTYRIVVIDSRSKREGAPIEELGFYNPKTKEMKLNKAQAVVWVQKGAQPTETVQYLMKNCKEDGSLDYKKKETVKLSKKALAKEAEAKKAAEEAKNAPKEEPVAAADALAAEAAEAAIEIVAEIAEQSVCADADAATPAAAEVAAENSDEASGEAASE